MAPVDLEVNILSTTKLIASALPRGPQITEISKSAELRIPLREFLERAIELALNGDARPVNVQQTSVRTIWNDEYIVMQADQPIGSPVELTDEEARAIAKDAFGNR